MTHSALREGIGDVGVAERNGRELGYAALSALEALPLASDNGFCCDWSWGFSFPRFLRALAEHELASAAASARSRRQGCW